MPLEKTDFSPPHICTPFNYVLEAQAGINSKTARDLLTALTVEGLLKELSEILRLHQHIVRLLTLHSSAQRAAFPLVELDKSELQKSFESDGKANLKVPVKVLDTRLAACLYETILRDNYMMLGSLKLSLAPLPPNVPISTTNRPTLDAINQRRKTMNMDLDLWKNVHTSVELEAGSVAAANERYPNNAKKLTQYISENVKQASVYSDSGEPTAFAKALVFLFRMESDPKVIYQLLRDENRYVRLVAATYLRYVAAPEGLIAAFLDVENLLGDTTLVSYTTDEAGSVKDMLQKLLFEDEVYEAWFPRYPPHCLDRFRTLLSAPPPSTSAAATAPSGNQSSRDGGEMDGSTAAISKKKDHGFGQVLLSGFASIHDFIATLEEQKRISQLKQKGVIFEDNVTSGEILRDREEPQDAGNVDGGKAEGDGERSGTSRKRGREAPEVRKRKVGEFRVKKDSVYLEF